MKPVELEFERSLVGSLIVEPDRFPERIAVAVAQGVREEWFEDLDCRNVFRAAQQLPAKAVPTTEVLAQALVERAATADVQTALRALQKISETVASGQNLEHFIAKVQAVVAVRAQAKAREELILALRGGDKEQIDHAFVRFQQLGGAPAAAVPSTRYPTRVDAETLTALGEQIERRMRGEERPIPWPFESLNKIYAGGLWPGLHMLVGNTGCGKSQLAVQTVLSAVEHGIPTLVIGLELSKKEMLARMLALQAGVSWSDVYYGREADAVHRALGERGRLAQRPLYFDEGNAYEWTAYELAGVARGMRERHPETKPGSAPVLIVLDFLQLVSGEKELRERIQRTAYAARTLAKQLNLTFLVISSTARENYERLSSSSEESSKGRAAQPLGEGNPARLVGLGKESGEIEFSADSVVVLGRGPWEEGEAAVDVHVAIAKHRGGRTGWAKLGFNGSRFAEDRLF